jgi:hypothetical protein
VEFLRARLDEDEQTARAIQWDGSGNSLDWGLPASATVDIGGDDFYAGDRTVASHIARHDPARVLREVEAKRAFVKEYERYRAERRRAMNGWDTSELSPIIAALASVYADHPDYQQEWNLNLA